FMYCRFVPYLKTLAKKVVFIVQDELYELVKSSNISEGIEVFSSRTNLDEIDFDLHMALLDVPCVCNINSEYLPYSDKYLDVSENQVMEYKTKYLLNSRKMKVGIAYQGSKSANYNRRDIDFSRFGRLFQLENIEFYSFVLEEEADDRIIYLGKTFNNFTDTASAIKNMDLMISTDNVILNLSGALGVKTYGLFNKYPNFRWFKLIGHNVGWYDSVVPLQVDENNCWADVFSELIKILSENSKNKF
ncbi:MAG: hypothetical protein K2F57_02110, partial [Candidatus Gastranaerophilales bacterium]|nr:hypothetical protein [Candidatus Gastranaerophilales bacterium]